MGKAALNSELSVASARPAISAITVLLLCVTGAFTIAAYFLFDVLTEPRKIDVSSSDKRVLLVVLMSMSGTVVFLMILRLKVFYLTNNTLQVLRWCSGKTLSQHMLTDLLRVDFDQSKRVAKIRFKKDHDVDLDMSLVGALELVKRINAP